MQETDELLSRMADIELPPPPDWTLAWLSGMLIILLVALAWWWRKTAHIQHHQPGIQQEPSAHHQLEILQAQWRSGSLPDRETAYRLATILRLGLGLPQLTANCPEDLRHDETTWQATIKFLNSARYQKQAITPMTPELFKYVDHCLSVTSTAQE